MQVITHRSAEVGLADLAAHLILELVEQGAGLGMHLKLEIYKQLKIFFLLLGVLLHELSESFAADIVINYSPFALNDGDFVDLGDIQRLLDPRLVECLVKDVSL